MKKALLLILLSMFMAFGLFTENVFADTVTISGHVVDGTGSPIIDASVKLENGSGTIYTATTDSTGDWSISVEKNSGTFILTVTSDGKAPFINNNVVIGEIDQNFDLMPLEEAIPYTITFTKNPDTLTYTSTPEDLTQIIHNTLVHFKAIPGTPTTQIDYYSSNELSLDEVTITGTEMVFYMPNGNVGLTAKGSTFIDSINITLDPLTDGATSIEIPTLSGDVHYTISGITCKEVGGAEISMSNPLTNGKQYVIEMNVNADTGYSFKYEGNIGLYGSDIANQYAYNVTTKINGNNIPRYTSAGSTGTSGYKGTATQEHNSLTINYYFTQGSTGGGGDNPTPSGGSSEPSLHTVLNTGVH